MALIDRGRVMTDYLENIGRKDSYKAKYEALSKAVDGAPAVDAAPVVHGRWKSANMFGVTVWECNECNAGFGRKWEYCPHCGAKMDKEE